jgi:predicted phage tail protein
MLSADNSVILERSFDMLHVTSPYQAEEICENILKRSRNNLKAEVTITSEGLNLAIGDIVTATYSTAGFTAKPFRIMSLSINADSTVNLGLEEHQDDFYTWASKVSQPIIPDTTLPNVFSVTAPVSVTLDDQLIEYSDGVVITALDVTIGASLDNFVDYYQVEYKLSTATDYIIHGQGKGLTQRILNVIDGSLYNVRVKAFNTLGVSSTYTSASRTIIGGTAPPADVEDFSCNIIGRDAHLSWTQISDLDLAYYSIRFSTLTSNAEWSNSVSLVEKVARPATSVTLPARIGSYLIKAFDKNGNASNNATIIATNILEIGDFNAVVTQTESPTFSGTKTNVYVDSGAL